MADQDSKNPEQEVLFKEIDEELRQENLAKVWKKYGNAIIGAAVLLVVSVAGFKGWQAYDVDRRETAATTLLGAVTEANAGKGGDALVALDRLAQDGPAGYALLARFHGAARLIEQGDTAGAATRYRAIAGDSGVDTLYRDLAEVLGALVDADAIDPAELRARVQRLDTDDNPWRHSAREISAIAALRAGDKAAAKTFFDTLAGDAGTPAGMRQRAQAMALHLTN